MSASQTVPYQGVLSSQAVSFGKPPPTGENPRSVALSLQFTQTNVPGGAPMPGNLSIDCNLSNLNSFSQIETLFVDNSNSPTRTFIAFKGTSELLIVEPSTRGFYPVASSVMEFTVSNAYACTVDVIAYNIIIPPILNSSIPSDLISQDIVVPRRVGSMAGSAIVPATNGTIFPIPNFGLTEGYEFYYITHLSILFVGYSSASSPQIGSVSLCDIGSGASRPILREFALASTFSPPSGPLIIDLIDLQGVYLTGAAQLCLVVAGTITGCEFIVNVVGGVTNNPGDTGSW